MMGYMRIYKIFNTNSYRVPLGPHAAIPDSKAFPTAFRPQGRWGLYLSDTLAERCKEMIKIFGTARITALPLNEGRQSAGCHLCDERGARNPGGAAAAGAGRQAGVSRVGRGVGVEESDIACSLARENRPGYVEDISRGPRRAAAAPVSTYVQYVFIRHPPTHVRILFIGVSKPGL